MFYKLFTYEEKILFLFFFFIDQTGGVNCEMADKTSEAA